MKDLPSLLKNKAKELSRFIYYDAFRILGVEAKKHFQKSFHDEGFTDKTLEPWKEVKRRSEDRKKRNKNGTISKSQPRDQLRKILTDTKTLRDSIHDKPSRASVEVGTDDLIGKAQAHNEGTTTAGRNRNVTIPKRQYMGDSQQLSVNVEKIYKEKVTKILQS